MITLNNEIKAPIKKGEKIGQLTVYEGKEKAGQYDLVSDREAEKASLMTIYIRMMKKLA